MSSEIDTLFPEQTVTLYGGRSVVVEPWGLATGRLLAPKLASFFEKAAGDFSSKGLVHVINTAQEDAYFIVQQTMGWSDEEMDKLKYEDLFTLVQKIIEVCVFRETDKGGAAGKLLALALQGSLRVTRGTSPEPSSSSAPTATTGEPSETTPDAS